MRKVTRASVDEWRTVKHAAAAADAIIRNEQNEQKPPPPEMASPSIAGSRQEDTRLEETPPTQKGTHSLQQSVLSRRPNVVGNLKGTRVRKWRPETPAPAWRGAGDARGILRNYREGGLDRASRFRLALPLGTFPELTATNGVPLSHSVRATYFISPRIGAPGWWLVHDKQMRKLAIQAAASSTGV